MSPDRVDYPASRMFSGPPNGYFVVVPGNAETSAFNFGRMAALARTSWKLLLAATVLAGIAGVVISLRMRDVYRAQAIIAPVQQNGNGNSMKNQIGGLAALAGIDIGEAGAHKAELLATLTSSGLAREFIADQDLLPILYAENWDASNHRWRNGKAPLLDKAVKRLSTSVLVITENHNTGIVTVSGEWYSPELAARWANRIVEMANDRLRAEASTNADRRVQYLNMELAKTSVEEIRQGIYHLIEEQVSNAMLANVERDYAYHVIDPAIPPQVKFAPQRSLIAAGSALGGFVLALVFVLIRGSNRAHARPSDGPLKT